LNDVKLDLLKAAPTEMKLKSLQHSLLCAFLIKFNKIPGVLRDPGTTGVKSRANLVESITKVCTSLKMYEKGPGGGGGGAAAASKVDASPALNLAGKIDAIKVAIRDVANTFEDLKTLEKNQMVTLLKGLGDVCGGDCRSTGNKPILLGRIKVACINLEVYEEPSDSNAVGATAAPSTHDAKRRKLGATTAAASKGGGSSGKEPAHAAAAASTGPTYADVIMAIRDPVEDGTSDWREAKDGEGNAYYWNVKTRDVTWDRPITIQEPGVASKQKADGIDKGD